MERAQEGRQPQEVKTGKQSLKEMLFLAEQAKEAGLKVLPGQRWAFHYPSGGSGRDEALKGLLEGSLVPDEAVNRLKPDAVIYDIKDIEKDGLEAVSSRIREATARIAYYDYQRLAEFAINLQGKQLDPMAVEQLYGGLAQSRMQKKLLDAYGHTGRQQMESALKHEGQVIVQAFDQAPPTKRIFDALKVDWLCEKRQLVRTSERDQLVQRLSESEKQLFTTLKYDYGQYVETGNDEAYRQLVEQIRQLIPDLQQLESSSESDQPSESMQELQQELEPYMDQVGPPGTPDDPAIPPTDSDEYHTPPPEAGEAGEQAASRPFFEITPSGSSPKPMVGYYCSGRKSYYDPTTKTWSKRKQLTPYVAAVADEQRQTISGSVGSGLTSIPIPNTYTLDIYSLKYTGSLPKVHRDQNGCFYLETTGPCQFSIDFAKEIDPQTGRPVPEDLQLLHRSSLSPETEAAIQQLTGSNLDKALQVQRYVLSHHFYPGGGDLQAAQALQHKLRVESSADDYITNLDRSEYLECYSANTLFVAMVRQVGVPARLVFGHKIDTARKGKAAIDSSTGHAWAEIWDGQVWRRVDATPSPKPEDKKPNEDRSGDKNETTPSQEPDDNGMSEPTDQSSPSPEGQTGQSQPGEASDSEVQQAQQQLDQAEQQLDQMEQRKQELQEQIKDINSFNDLEKIKEQLEQEDLIDEIRQEVEEKLEAKEEEMKNEIKEQLDQMVDDGFLDEQQRDQLIEKLEQEELKRLDRLMKEIEQEKILYDQYEAIKEEVMPLVDSWFDYFVERLPRQTEIVLDEDSLTRQGAVSKRAAMRPRNLIFGTVKNPRIIDQSIRPLFLASLMVDVSGSMAGKKLESAQKLLIFFCELFSRIEQEFGYIRFSINTFSDKVKTIKEFDHDYDSAQRYLFPDKTQATVKARLMKELKVQGGTNMLDAVQQAAKDLNEQTYEYPDYASAFYFFGDGGDSYRNEANIRSFLQLNDFQKGFGEHMYSAILLGNQSQKQELATVFGDDHTTVAPDFDTLIEEAMTRFDEDIEEYLDNKIM